MRCAPLLAAALALASPGPAAAAGYAVLGSATVACADWTTARHDPTSAQATGAGQWVLGFLSGVGFMMLGELDPLRGMTADALHGWLDQYCTAHPQDTLEAAARMFIHQHPR